MRSLIFAGTLLVSAFAFAGGAQIEIAEGYSGGMVTIRKVELFGAGKSGYSSAAIGSKEYNKTCLKHGCLQIRTDDDRRCYIPHEDLRDQGIDPVQLGIQLLDEKSTVWISCFIKPVEAKYMHGLATSFHINSGNEKKEAN
jgi:hypothetical protein